MHLDDALLTTEGRVDPQLWAAARRLGHTIGDCAQHHVRVTAGEIDRGDFYGRVSYTVVCPGGHDAAVPAGRIVRNPTALPIYGVWSAELAEAARARDAAILGEHDLEPVPA